MHNYEDKDQFGSHHAHDYTIVSCVPLSYLSLPEYNLFVLCCETISYMCVDEYACVAVCVCVVFFDDIEAEQQNIEEQNFQKEQEMNSAFTCSCRRRFAYVCFGKFT